MTTIVLNYSTSLLESLSKSLKTLLINLYIGWTTARQKSTNREVAILLLRHARSDYMHETVDSLTVRLNEKMGLK